MKTVIIHVDYDDLNPQTYKGIDLHIMGGKKPTKKSFKGTSPKKQIINAAKWCKAHNLSNIMCSSSVDHFEMDGGSFEK